MTRLIKLFLWIGLLVFNLQCVWGFALLGPTGNGGDAWQVKNIGYDPLNTDIGSPKNLGEEYRRNTPMLYYSYDANFLDYFGSNGVVEVDKAFAIMNALTNVDNYDYADMSATNQFPFDTRQNNFTAEALGLLDLKSTALFTIVEQMGLADPVRYTWTLHDRTVEMGFTNPCPAGILYLVIQRNFDPITWRPTNVVNNVMYGYTIQETCKADPEPEVDAVETSAFIPPPDSPVASAFSLWFAGLGVGQFYTGLTWDDVGGLKYLLRSNNIVYEDLAPGSTPIAGSGSTVTNLNDEFTLVTLDLRTFLLAASTNNPAALLALYPELVIVSVITNFNGTFTYTFGNVVTNHFSPTSSYQIQVRKTTITIAPVIGAPAGSPDVTNTVTSTKTTTVVSNLVSGDFFLIPTNTCGLNVIQTLATNGVTLTNSSGSFTNVSGDKTTITQTNFVTSSTNHTLLVAPCEFLTGSAGTNSTTGLFQGVENIKFTRAFFDSLLGQFFQPITNQYKVVMISNSKLVPLTFQRVVTAPDILFSAADLAAGPAVAPGVALDTIFNRSINFDQNNIGSGLAGPGTIYPPSKITFTKVGNIFENAPLEDTNAVYSNTNQFSFFVWGSFDASTNPPVVYPNGADIQNLENEILIQISPASLPDGTNGMPYPATTFMATGGAFSPPFTWSAPGGLPPGLNLSSGGTLSGIPTQSGTFDFVIQMTDAVSRSVQWIYSVTIH